MRYYILTEKQLLEDLNDTVIFQESHDWVIFNEGNQLMDYEEDDEKGKPFEGPLMCVLDDEDGNGTMPVFFSSPAIIGIQKFTQVFKDFGVINMEVFPVVIKDENKNKEYTNYELINFLGTVPYSKNKYHLQDIDGRDAVMIGKTGYVLLSEQLKEAIVAAGFDKIIFDEVEVTH